MSTTLEVSPFFCKATKHYFESPERERSDYVVGGVFGIAATENSPAKLLTPVFVGPKTDPDITSALEAASKSLPGGIDCLGILVCCFSGERHSPAHLRDQLQRSGSIGLIISCYEHELLNDAYDLVEAADSAGPVSLQISSKDMFVDTLSLRLSYQDQFQFECGQKSEVPAHLRRALEQKVSRIHGEYSYFQAKERPDWIVGQALPIEANIGLLLDQINDSGEKKKQKSSHFSNDCVEFQILELVTGVNKVESLLNSSPVVLFEKRNLQYATIRFKIDCFAICHRNTGMDKAVELMRKSAVRQLCLITDFITDQVDINDNLGCITPVTFYPKRYIPHFLSVCLKEDEAKKMLHKFWNLPEDRPFFQPIQRHRFPKEAGPYLINVHTALSPSGVGGTVSLVDGDYAYHHYMQDGVNDNGWGCAYRSFQTLWSWFRLQGYTEKPVPTHREIQETLVRLGDKESSFIGSRLWVGSLELSYCLNEMLGVTSRIATASNGEEMADKARELSIHFQTQGTPIMIGGGVLAHTILGIDFDEDSGAVKFLVLDPHYTGEENIKTIIDKGWCGWKPVSFWEKQAFYNMLLPQRPKAI